MRPLLLLAISSAVGAGAWLAPSPSQIPPALRGHCDALYAAKTLQVKVTVQAIPGATEEVAVVLAKDGKYSLDSPSRAVVSDGTNLIVWDKKANTYKKRPVGESVAADLGGEVSAWALLPFFEKDTAKLYSSGAKKGARKVAGVDTDEVAVVTPAGEQGTVYVSKSDGVAVGFQLTRGEKTFVVLFKDAKVNGEGVADSLFAFVPPAGATEAKTEEETAGWETVAPIFARSCMPCHGEQKQKGLDYRTYEAVMQGGSVVPGDPAASRVVRSLRGQIQPRMPQGRPPLPEATIKKVEAWIAAGAKP